ncbi:TVP38/TMEM64 family protein [Haloplanus halophilus]|uniref:TVP38/TMEM64 family protein n=1 Tax=Haloplanus halophilus TaxID=2949993 RepID=UPI0031B8033C
MRRRAIRRALLVVAALAVGAVLIGRFAPFLADPAWIRGTVERFGPLAPLAFVCLQALQVVAAPIPGQALGGVGGYLFGTWPGFVYSMVGVTVGSAVAFVLAERYGRPFVERTFDADAVDRFDAVADDVGPVALFALFLLPTFPDDLLCALAGVSTMRLRTLLALVVVGRAPSFALVAYAGDSAAAAEPLAALTALGGVALLTAAVYAVRAYRTASA